MNARTMQSGRHKIDLKGLPTKAEARRDGGKLSSVNLDEPIQISAYLNERYSKACSKWEKNNANLIYDDPENVLLARVFEVGCKLIDQEKADTFISHLKDLQAGRGQRHGNVFSALFSHIESALPPKGFAPSACRKMAAVMILAKEWDVHPKYLNCFAAMVRGWSGSISFIDKSNPPTWVAGLTRSFQEGRRRENSRSQ